METKEPGSPPARLDDPIIFLPESGKPNVAASMDRSVTTLLQQSTERLYQAVLNGQVGSRFRNILRNTESGMYKQTQKAAYRCSVWAWRSWATLGIGFADHYRTKIDDSKKSLFCMLIGGGEVMIRLSGKGSAYNAKGPPRGTKGGVNIWRNQS
ncbi:hypothetical protein CIHG_07535 [Coccidioides immitis H538.4]|uniref:Uncharacterized protein n=1 Tax=Coccidioides immitis H538.4 TaxID=396776 RepID=A0A0J8RYH8_COCIT|nr:hypothetical protein CIHG_07535 [Coccidioides immitis H538.4]